jgi:hypothetical protein
MSLATRIILVSHSCLILGRRNRYIVAVFFQVAMWKMPHTVSGSAPSELQSELRSREDTANSRPLSYQGICTHFKDEYCDVISEVLLQENIILSICTI